jgi:hypothetical protein
MNYNISLQPTSWFNDKYRDGSLTISPPYQRKPVWAARQKCYLIESMLLGLPVPEVFVQQKVTADGKSTFAIVDGQQRIRTVLQFIGSDLDPDEQQYSKFRLDKIETTSRWRNVSFADLPDENKKAFFGYLFAVRYLNTESDDEVRDMFKRLNKFLTPLKPQELRNATFLGPFVKLSLHLADNEYWAENSIVTSSAIRRMADVEFVSELLIALIHGPQAGSALAIDEYYNQYEDYDDEFPSQRSTEKLFAEVLATVQAVLPDIKGSRWCNKTDFYSLFAAFGKTLKNGELPPSKVNGLRKTLLAFGDKVDERLGDETMVAEAPVIEYVRAVEKGANDKARRSTRHVVLCELMSQFFKTRKN